MDIELIEDYYLFALQVVKRLLMSFAVREVGEVKKPNIPSLYVMLKTTTSRFSFKKLLYSYII